MEKVLIIHHSEIALKRKKRSFFEKKLADNIRYVLGKSLKLVRDENRLVINNPPEPLDDLMNRVRKVFGVSHVGAGFRCEPSVEAISETVLKTLAESNATTIAIDVKRSYKQHPFTSQHVRIHLSRLVEKQLGVKTDRKSEAELNVEITRNNAYVYLKKLKGFDGLPVGSSGTVLSLLSGGIDSAVASLLMMRRGCRVDFLHIHSYRSSQEALEAKMSKVVEKLTEYGLRTKLYMASFAPFYRTVLTNPSRLELLLFRKYILKTAEQIARTDGYDAIVLGDSLAQVASQTLSNIVAVRPSTDVLVFRPLIGFAKNDIVELADKFEITNLVQKSYKDCCSIVARHPATAASFEEVEDEWTKLGLDNAVEQTLKNIETHIYTIKAGDVTLSSKPAIQQALDG